MNLNERAELAYEHHIDNYGIDWGSDCELFTTGYIAVIKQSIEMDFDQVKEANEYWAMVPDIGWRKGVIVGGESGRNARSLDMEWVRDISLACMASQVPCFVKQLGAKVRMSFDEWNDLTNGGSTGSANFISDEPGSDFGIWRPVDPKGGDPSEWPENLCVREFPENQK